MPFLKGNLRSSQRARTAELQNEQQLLILSSGCWLFAQRERCQS